MCLVRADAVLSNILYEYEGMFRNSCDICRGRKLPCGVNTMPFGLACVNTCVHKLCAGFCVWYGQLTNVLNENEVMLQNPCDLRLGRKLQC